MLSVNISAYKGDIPRNHVLVSCLNSPPAYPLTLCMQDILKRYRFDLPAGIEHDLANWEKISVFVGYTLTQARARVKKAVWNRILLLTEVSQLFHRLRKASGPTLTYFPLHSRLSMVLPAE